MFTFDMDPSHRYRYLFAVFCFSSIRGVMQTLYAYLVGVNFVPVTDLYIHHRGAEKKVRYEVCN
ncbi:predicted protein [Pyrenophora tritici-repentis Pt-1C-BFP]|uniref:Uncharacterized protein n=1 Tax=Pyrenophora tritici-repentis (strain Pt-1C-BFP) TaxID=426418 RepID=B2WMS6_PYRTR|nr:uncharacterized protein PTRG_11286 [Pyrenophora tritici-repentis Pt-1C-BFP]EDU44336.1 predicted protein [Pyrenophora tritici-repentis Pt-1C-BFP]